MFLYSYNKLATDRSGLQHPHSDSHYEEYNVHRRSRLFHCPDNSSHLKQWLQFLHQMLHCGKQQHLQVAKVFLCPQCFIQSFDFGGEIALTGVKTWTW